MKINFNLLKKYKKLIIFSSVIIVLAGLGTTLYFKNYSAKVGNFTFDPTEDLVIHISEKTASGLKPGFGIVNVKSGCLFDVTSGGTQNGTFRCTLGPAMNPVLTNPDYVYMVGAITYSNSISHQTYSLIKVYGSHDDDLQIKRDLTQDFVINVIIDNGKPFLSYDHPDSIYNPEDILPTTTADTSPSHGPGDCNADGKVDDYDFSDVVLHFGGPGPIGDCNGDGKVDDFDFSDVVTHMGTTY